MFDRHVTKAIKDDACERYPEESCGIVVDNKYLAFNNVADDPLNEFRINERQLVPYLGKIQAIVHSHPMGPDCPSESDMLQQLAWRVPFGIVSTDGSDCLEPFYWGDDAPIAPLIGRGFRHGVTDCYACVRDYFRVELDITLNDYPREWEWWKNDDEHGKLYERFFEREGFFRIDPHEVRQHDCFLASIRSDTPNHAGVYVGRNLILHHLTSRSSSDPSALSRREPIGIWQKFICGFWVRHESQRNVENDSLLR